MKVWTTADFDGVWLNGCAVVVADTEDRAAEILNAELQKQGLKFDGALVPLDLGRENVQVLFNGDY